jgi:hypothetical protein
VAASAAVTKIEPAAEAAAAPRTLARMSSPRFSEVRPRPSVDQLLRTVQQHHVHLSALADTKAGLIITISSIVLTIALSRAGDPQLRAALLTLAVACLLALLLAIFAVLPTFAPGRLKGAKQRRNLLFFGHFATLSEEEFLDEMEKVIGQDTLLIESALRDIYSLGTYLYRKKYRLLRMSYVALVTGFILATLVEVIVLI